MPLRIIGALVLLVLVIGAVAYKVYSSRSADDARPAGSGPQQSVSLDTIGSETVADTDEVSLPAGARVVKVTGWAIDREAGVPATAVRLIVDGDEELPATYGTPRPDVATAFGDPAYTNVGFEAEIPASFLPAGTHTLETRVIGQGGAELETPDTIRLTITAAKKSAAVKQTAGGKQTPAAGKR